MFWITKEFTNLEPAVDICTCTILWCKYIFTLKVVINLRLTYFQNQYKLMEGYSRGSNKRKIAICSTNFVQIWKGRNQKTVFCSVRHKKKLSRRWNFCYDKPCKNCLLMETFLYENKLLRTNNFFLLKLYFFKGLKNSFSLH